MPKSPAPADLTDEIAVPAHGFATAWLNVAIAAGDDEERPALYRAVTLERLPEGVRLVATDGYVLLRSFVPLDPFGASAVREGPADDETGPVLVARDLDHRMRGLMQYVRKLTKDDPLATLSLRQGSIEDEETPTLTSDLERLGLIVETEHERLALELYEGPPVDWRRLLGEHVTKRTDAVATTAELWKRLGGLVGDHTSVVLDFALGGKHGALRFDALYTVPRVDGLVMPTKLA